MRLIVSKRWAQHAAERGEYAVYRVVQQALCLWLKKRRQEQREREAESGLLSAAGSRLAAFIVRKYEKHNVWQAWQAPAVASCTVHGNREACHSSSSNNSSSR